MIRKGFVNECVELMCLLVWLCGVRKPRKCSSKWTTWYAAMLLLLQQLHPVSDKGQHNLACYPQCRSAYVMAKNEKKITVFLHVTFVLLEAMLNSTVLSI